jgi:hypothetical protein
MGQGRARARSRLRRAAAVSASLVLAVTACSALAASASAGSSRRPAAARIDLRIDTGGPLGLSVPLSPLAAGDVRERTATLRDRSGGGIAALVVDVAESHRSRGGADALEVRIDRCSRPWLLASTASLRCPGRLDGKVAWRRVGAGIARAALGGTDAGAVYLRISTRMPATAGEDQEGFAARLDYRFTAA